MSIAEKLTTIAENEQKVYEAGQSSMVDKTKIIEKSASGKLVMLYDVSEIPHDVKVTLSSDGQSITDYSNVNLTIYKNNQWTYIDSIETEGDGTTKAFLDTSNPPIYGTLKFSCDVEVSNITYSSKGNMVFLGVTATGKDIEYFGIVTDKTTNGKYSCIIDATSPVTRLVLTRHQRCTGGTIKITNIQLYDPNEEQTITANADGTVEGIKSLSPNMCFNTDNTDVIINVDYWKSYGMQTEYDRFWDACQGDGSQKSYVSRFAGAGWNDDTFKPKYDIVVSTNGMVRMFSYSYIRDLRGILERQGVTLDVSAGANFTNMCENSRITRFPILDISKANSGYAIFVGCTLLKSIQKIVLKADGTTPISNQMFQSCTALEEIEEIEGVIGKNIDLHWATKLTHDTLMRIINALQDKSEDTSGTNWALTIGTENQDKLTDSEKAVATQKGWTIA